MMYQTQTPPTQRQRDDMTPNHTQSQDLACLLNLQNITESNNPFHFIIFRSELLFSMNLPRDISEKYNYLKQQTFQALGLPFQAAVSTFLPQPIPGLQPEEYAKVFADHLGSLLKVLILEEDSTFMQDDLSKRFLEGQLKVPSAEVGARMDRLKQEFD